MFIKAYTTGPPLCTARPLLSDHVETKGRKKFYRKLRDILGFHMIPTIEQP